VPGPRRVSSWSARDRGIRLAPVSSMDSLARLVFEPSGSWLVAVAEEGQ
jgi:hypothetical protein